MKTSTAIQLLGLTASLTSALTPAKWRSQSIYQVVTDRFAQTDGSTTASCDPAYMGGVYCNGTFQGLINKLDYIQNMGFTAIWISPVVENLEGNTPDGSAYHGYWAQRIYEINEHFGTASDLKALSNALHNRGMYLMVDIVINHMGYYGAPSTIDYSVFEPFNKSSYYHPYCQIDYSNATSTQDCWEGDTTVPLPDLANEDAIVQGMWTKWLKQFIKNYTIDGLRLDSAQQTGNTMLPIITETANEYVVGEVFNGNPEEACPYQGPLPAILNYPTYFWITQAFQDSTGSMYNLFNGTSWMQSKCKDTTLLGSFTENQDNPRFASYTEDIVRAMNVIGYTLLQDGIPILYYGQEQHYNGAGVPVNREALWLSGYNTSAPLYGFTKAVNKFRSMVISQSPAFVTSKIVPISYDDHSIVTRKGKAGHQVVAIYSNYGENGAYYTMSLPKNETLFAANEKILEVLSCTVLTADKKGNVVVPMGGGLPKILYPYKNLQGSRICESPTPDPTTTSVAPTSTCTSASIHFSELVNTIYGESVVITGNIPQLGTWNPGNGVYLNANNYSQNFPQWQGDAMGIDPEEVFQYKAVIIGKDGSYNYQPGPNLQATAPGGCIPTTTISNTYPSAT